jgi:hypothetical protein
MQKMLVMLAFVAAAAIVAAVALTSSGRSSSTSAGLPIPTKLPTATPAGQMTLYGHIKTLKRASGHKSQIQMRFDPAWVTSGLTARRASLADTGSSDVPNDYYYVEAGHRLLTYIVTMNAKIRVLTNHGTGPVLTPIRLSELYRIVNGEPHRKLFESLHTGVWIRVHTDTIREIDQQYQP